MKPNKSLAFLLAGITLVDPEKDAEIYGLNIDSRLIKRGDLFIAYPGEHVDGRKFILQAIKAGASAILAEEDSTYNWPLLPRNVILLQVKDVRHKIGQIASKFYDHPSRYMHLTGVTGTNGKTSIAYLLSYAFNTLNLKNSSCIYFGTLGTGFPNALQETSHTTLDAIHIQQYLANFSKKGVTHAALEVSSHALDQGRVAHVEFQTAVFTNLTRDHLDYHKTMEAYGEAKAKLFKQFGLKSAVINWDDAFGLRLYESLSENIFKIGYSLTNPNADIYVNNVLMTDAGTSGNIQTPWGEGILKTPLIGRFNLYNIMAVVGVLGLSYPLEKVLKCLESLPHVPGRMECIMSKKIDKKLPLFVVDYAHTPDALQNVLLTARDLAQVRSGKLYCVFGCGGDRDNGKRPEMGKIAEKLADHIIITNDNPRTENDAKIAEEIVDGVANKRYLNVILDREKAIQHAFENAHENDVIVVAGKGHERYQIVGTEKHFFSDTEVCEKLVM